MADLHLMDLSGHDSDELMRFNEKRKGFESVLKVLEALPPINPFGMLVTDGMDLRELIGTSAPSPEQLDDMQMERDDIEGDVMNFDNGDLVRMKEKTRVITLSPLTRPSTELVSITLDLIVIVDRLLTLLRQRSELIDLCRLRLQWDLLRSQCLQDCNRISDSVEGIVADYLDWLPESIDVIAADFADRAYSESSPNIRTGSLVQDDNELTGPQTPMTPAQNKGNSSISPNASINMSPSPSMRKLRLPLIRSRIESLQILSDNLSMTVAPRLGGMLDKMIDTAAPLKIDEVAQGGAVPEFFLDAQDEIEARVSGLSHSLAFCRVIERWWTKAESTHDAMTHVHDSASRILVEMKLFATDPSVSQVSLDSIQTRLRDLRAALPSPVEAYSLIPTNSRSRDHDQQINNALVQNHREAQKVLTECDLLCEWSHRYLSSRSSLLDLCDSLLLRQMSLTELLDQSDDPGAIPVRDDSVSWLAKVSTVLAECKSSDLTKSATIALLKHRACAKGRPTSLHITPSEDISDPVLDQSEILIESVTSLVNELANKCENVDRILALKSAIHNVDNSANEASTLLSRLEAEITQYVDTNLWPALSSRALEEDIWKSQLARVTRTIQVDIEPRLTDLLTAVPDALKKRADDVRSRVDDVIQRLEHVETLFGLARGVRLQATTVASVQKEGEEMLVSILAARPTSDSIQDLRDEISAWEADVVARVPFVDVYRSSTADTNIPTHVSGVYPESSTRPLLTPPPSPPTASGARLPPLTRWDLAKTDRVVRTEINDITSRVRAQMERISADRPPVEAVKPLGSQSPFVNPVTASSQGSELGPDDIPIKLLRLSSSTNTSAASSRLPTPTRQRASLPRLHASQSSLSSSMSRTSHSRPSIPFSTRADRSRSISLGYTQAPQKPQKPRQTPRKYVANDRNQLDRAVGQIVNNLPIHIPIAPVGVMEPNKWNDLTGRYWVGTGGRAKLCYCRILRSQTVMVRVGGGWVELLEFLAEHFSETVSLPEVQKIEQPVTPCLPKTPANRNLASEAKSQPPSALSRSTSSSTSLSLAPGSPLAPSRFMRKASESPEDRKKEKNKLKIGRRSILGKE